MNQEQNQGSIDRLGSYLLQRILEAVDVRVKFLKGED